MSLYFTRNALSSTFKSKCGLWNEPINWHCKYCARKENTESSNIDEIILNPNAYAFSGKHRKSKVNTDSPEKQFLEATVDTLKATIAKNELDMKKLKEYNELKAKE